MNKRWQNGRFWLETVLPWSLIAFALAAFIGYFYIYNVYAFALFRFPFDYDQGEGFELMDTLLFSQGEWPYRSNDLYPFYSSNYPPLFHIAIMPLVWIFGPKYWTGRLVSYLGTLITAALIGYAVQRQEKRWWLALLCGLGYLASNYIYHVGPLFRQHLFMVMFETAAVVLMTIIIDREEKEGRPLNKQLLWVMALLLFAGYTKQLAYATVAAIFSFWFLRQPLRSIRWAIPFAAVTGLIFLWLNWATEGMWMLDTVTANINPFIPGQAAGLFRQWFGLHTIFIIAAGIYAVYQLYLERISLYSLWFFFTVLNSITAGKWGAGESYFATAIAASLILTGLLFGRLLTLSEAKDWRLKTAVAIAIPLLFIHQADRLFHMPTHTPFLENTARLLNKPTSAMIPPQTSCSAPREPQSIPYVDIIGPTLLGRPPSAADTAAGIAITEKIAALGDSPAFAEDAGFNFYLGRDIVTNPTQLLNLYKNNAVDLTEMIGMLDAQAFDSVVLRAQFYPPPVLDMLGQRYQTVELIEMNGFVYCIMEKR